jgi:hypothetical protein
MINKEELQRLAEACPDEPLRLVEYGGIMYLRNTAGIVLEVYRNRSFPQYAAINEAHARLVEAATPAVVLALLAEVKALSELAEVVAKKLRSAQICNPLVVDVLLDEAREALADHLPKGWPTQAKPQ